MGAHLTTCHFPQHWMERLTCRSCHASLSPIPPDPRLLLTYFPNLPKLLAQCWSSPSSDCENTSVMLSPFEKMAMLSSILKKCEKSTIIDLLLLCFVVTAMMPRLSDRANSTYQSWLTPPWPMKIMEIIIRTEFSKNMKRENL